MKLRKILNKIHWFIQHFSIQWESKIFFLKRFRIWNSILFWFWLECFRTLIKILRQNEHNTASWNLVDSSRWFNSNRRQTHPSFVQLSLLTCLPDECWCVVEMISTKTYWSCPFDRIPVLVDHLLCSMIEGRARPSVDSELEPLIEHFPMLHSILEFQAWSQTFTNFTNVIYFIIQMIESDFWQNHTKN